MAKRPQWISEFEINDELTDSYLLNNMIARFIQEDQFPDWLPRDTIPQFLDLPRVIAPPENSTDSFVPPPGWVMVEVEEDEELMIDITLWIIDHSKHRWFPDLVGVYFFEDHEEAMLFKLTWGGGNEVSVL